MFVKSDNINELTAALAKAQSKIEVAVFDSVNPHFRSKYASLSAVRDVVRKPFAENGLSVSQWLSGEGETVSLVTMLCHSSGQWMQSSFNLLLTKKDMQGLGSATTYARRYALAALAGVVSDEDDDGNHASAPVNKPVQRVPNHAPAPPTRTIEQEFAEASSAMGPEEWDKAQSQAINKPAGHFTASGIARAVTEKNKAEMEKRTTPPLPPGEDEAFDPGDYVMPFGFNKGKKLRFLKVEDIKKSIEWAKGAKATKNVTEFLQYAQNYMTMLGNQADAPPTDELPF